MKTSITFILLLLVKGIVIAETNQGHASAPAVPSHPDEDYITITEPLYDTTRIKQMTDRVFGSGYEAFMGSPQNVETLWNPIASEINREKGFFIQFYKAEGWETVRIYEEAPEILLHAQQALLAKEGHLIKLSQYGSITVPMGQFRKLHEDELKYADPEFVTAALKLFANVGSEGTGIVNGFSQSFYNDHPEFKGHEKEVSETWMELSSSENAKEWTSEEIYSRLVTVLHQKYPPATEKNN